jgi:hypothetical protein
VIELEDLLEAEQIITSIEADMSKVFSNIGLVDSARQTNEIVHLVGNFGFLPTKDLWKLCMNSMEFRTFQDNVRAAIEAGQVRAETRDSRPGLAIIRGSA